MQALTAKGVWRHSRLVALAALPLMSPAAQACDSCGAMVQLPINTGLQVAQITATTLAVVSAIGLNGGGNGANSQGVSAATFDAAKSGASMTNSMRMAMVQREANMKMVTNAQSTNCRLHTKNLITPMVENIRKQVGWRLERGIIDDVYFNANLTRDRIAAASLYRLCQNGQLRPSDFGPNWWATNACIDDPTTAHDFLKISTILDSPVLIPVSGNSPCGPAGTTRMDALNNPQLCTPPQMLALWNGLNDKQKKYVGAVRYCENLVISRIEPQNIRNDAALTIGNTATIVRNMGAAGSLASVSVMCQQEVGRRTALDPDDPAFPPGPARQALIDNRDKIINFLVNMRGGDPRELYAYSTPANFTANNPIPGAAGPKAWVSQYIIDRYPRDYGMSIKCAGYADSGSDAGRTGSMLQCTTLATLWEKNEAARRKAFIEAVAAIDQTPGFSGGAATPTRTNGVPGGGASPLLRDASLEIPGFDSQPMRLEEMLHTMNAMDAPARKAELGKQEESTRP